MSVNFLLAVLLSTSLSVSSHPNKKLKKEEFTSQINELKEKFGNNKIFLKDLELAALVALSYFPELSNTKIEFKHNNNKTTMAARPHIGSTFKKKEKRTYIIHVDNKIIGNNGLLVKNIPFNALVGLIGHEYAHILDYEKMTMWQMGLLGIKYTNKEFKKQLEQNTDKVIIERGLGWQLRDWAEYSMELCMASQEYKDFKKNTYLDKNQIFRLIMKNKLYHQHSTEKEKKLVAN